ncbi:hypothetical protein VTO42DRAFT_3529 [Malbranchea cinnamomea]
MALLPALLQLHERQIERLAGFAEHSSSQPLRLKRERDAESHGARPSSIRRGQIPDAVSLQLKNKNREAKFYCFLLRVKKKIRHEGWDTEWPGDQSLWPSTPCCFD